MTSARKTLIYIIILTSGIFIAWNILVGGIFENRYSKKKVIYKAWTIEHDLSYNRYTDTYDLQTIALRDDFTILTIYDTKILQDSLPKVQITHLRHLKKLIDTHSRLDTSLNMDSL